MFVCEIAMFSGEIARVIAEVAMFAGELGTVFSEGVSYRSLVAKSFPEIARLFREIVAVVGGIVTSSDEIETCNDPIAD